jgi:glycosyltransferase involved in cell wall biosynthesis
MSDNTGGTVDLAGILGRRPQIVIGHPHLGRGGSEARVMWLIESLKRDCNLTVITTGGWNLAELNQAYNTNVRPADVSVVISPLPGFLQRRPAAALRYGYYQRACQAAAERFDLCISAYGITDWGRPAIHFVADLCWASEVTAKATGRSPGFVYRDTVLRRAYLALCRRLIRPSGRDPMRQDLLLPTSRWGGSILERQLGAGLVRPLYPFLHSPAAAVVDREALCGGEIPFLSLGRIAAEKRLEDAIDILAQLRRRGHPVRLYLAGEIGTDPYGRRIKELCRNHAGWIAETGRVSGRNKQLLFAKVAFGVSTCRQEMFGNAVAEMVCGGIVPFAYKEGGPAEILSRPELLFSDSAEAVERMENVLRNSDLRRELRQHLLAQSHLFSLETTIETVRGIVADNLAGRVVACGWSRVEK